MADHLEKALMREKVAGRLMALNFGLVDRSGRASMINLAPWMQMDAH